MNFSLQEFSKDGRVWFRNAISEQTLKALDDWFGQMDGQAGKRRSVSSLPQPTHSDIKGLATEVLPGARAVRVVTFDKSKRANWAVPWHRDFVIVLDQNVDTDGYSNWTQRDGVWHARPPMELLDKMFFLRILLDDTSAESGDLEVALGSHRGEARYAAHDLGTDTLETEQTTGSRGDVLAVHALMLHRSASARMAEARRAIRIDFCAEELPEPLNWAA